MQRNSWYKSPEAGENEFCSRNREKSSVAATQWGKGLESWEQASS